MPSTHRQHSRRLDRLLLVVFQAETDFHRHLVVRNLRVLYMPANPGDLEPVEMAQGLSGPVDAVFYGFGDPLGRGADDFRNTIGAITHMTMMQARRVGVFLRYGTQAARSRRGLFDYLGKTSAYRRHFSSGAQLRGVDGHPHGVFRRRSNCVVPYHLARRGSIYPRLASALHLRDPWQRRGPEHRGKDQTA